MMVSLGDSRGYIMNQRITCLHSDAVSRKKKKKNPLPAQANLQRLGGGVSLLYGPRDLHAFVSQCVILASEAEIVHHGDSWAPSILSSCFVSSLRCRHVEEVLQNQRMLLESVTTQVAHKKSSLQTSAKQIEDR